MESFVHGYMVYGDGRGWPQCCTLPATFYLIIVGLSDLVARELEAGRTKRGVGTRTLCTSIHALVAGRTYTEAQAEALQAVVWAILGDPRELTQPALSWFTASSPPRQRPPARCRCAYPARKRVALPCPRSGGRHFGL